MSLFCALSLRHRPRRALVLTQIFFAFCPSPYPVGFTADPGRACA